MKPALIIAAIVLFCTGCAVPNMGAPEMTAHDTAANTSANYNFKGNLNHANGDDCWYRCFWRM